MIHSGQRALPDAARRHFAVVPAPERLLQEGRHGTSNTATTRQ